MFELELTSITAIMPVHTVRKICSFVIGGLAPARTKTSRRGKLVQMTTLKPRGADGGPKRSPSHLGMLGNTNLLTRLRRYFLSLFF